MRVLLNSKHPFHPRPRRLLIFTSLVTIATLAPAISKPAKAAGLIEDSCAGADVADISVSPQKFARWTSNQITWKMNQDFVNAYPSAYLRYLVREAFRDMELAANQPNPMPFWRATYHREDPVTAPNFDLRSTIIHELGHVLGLQHADAVAYNTNPQTNQPYNLNFQFDNNGVPFKSATYGGELMNEGYSDTPGVKGPKGLAQGEYHRVPAIDEVDVFNYMDLDFDFVEVGANDPADIVIGVWNNPQDGSLGAGCPSSYQQIVPNDASQGWEISSGGFSINAGKPITMNTDKRWYEFNNTTGNPVHEIQLQVDGTSTEIPVTWNSSGGNRFTTIFRQTAGFDQEWGLYSFDQPLGGAILPGNSVEFALELDVHDWVVEHAVGRSGEYWFPIPLADIESTEPLPLLPPSKPPGEAVPLGVLPTAPGHTGPEDLGVVPPNLMPSGGFLVRPASADPVVVDRVEVFHVPADHVRNRVPIDAEYFDRLAASDPNSVVDLGIGSMTLVQGMDLLFLFGASAQAPDLEKVSGRSVYRIPETVFQPAGPVAIRTTLSNGYGSTKVISLTGEIPGADNLDALCSVYGTAEACCVSTAEATVLTSRGDRGDVSANACTIAGDGNDRLEVNLPIDDSTRIALGNGADVLSVDSGIARVFGGGGRDDIHASGSGILLASGGDDDDELVGAAGNDELAGGAGDDYLLGGDGSDRIDGGDDDDTIYGDDGDDDISVGNGRDFVEAGAGNDRVELSACAAEEPDILDGGAGEDTLVIPGSLRDLLDSGADVRGFEHVIEFAGDGIDSCL